MTPLDLVKCRRQVDSKMYKGNFEAWGKIGRAEGIRGIFTGWSPTFFGYSVRFFNRRAGMTVLIESRRKVLSNTADTSTSKNSTLILLENKTPTNIRPRCTSPPVPRPNSLLISHFVHLRP